MRGLLWVLALFAAAVGLAIAARYNEGYVLFVLSPYRVELSLNLFVVVVLALFVAGYVLLRIAAGTLRMPAQVQAYRERRRRERAVRNFHDALRHLLEGRFGHALKAASAAARAGEAAPALTPLFAARAARAMADDPAEERWLQEAARQPDELRLARLMTELELHVDARRFGAALETLEAIGAGGKRHVAAQRLALKVYRAVGRWEELLRVVRQLEKHRALSAEQAASLKQLAHVERIRAFSGDTGAIAAYWARLPGDERVLPRIGPAVVRGLLDGGEHEIAQRIIEYRLDDAWDEPLVSMYAECEGGEALGRVTKAENWLRSHPDDPILLRTLGRLCMQLQLWGKAQSYLEASLAVRASRSVHLELARLLDSLDRRGDADRHYRAAAEQRA